MSFLPTLLDVTVGHLESPIATISAGLSISSVVFVILTAQVWIYFWRTSTHDRDPLWIRSLVIFIWLMQALGIALAYYMTVLLHGKDNTPLTEGPLRREFGWLWGIYAGTSATTECLVHAYLISRIYLLETKVSFIQLSIILCVILVLETSFALVYMMSIILFTTPNMESAQVMVWTMPTWLGLSLLADISIAASICYVLRQNSPFTSMRLNLLVKRLTIFFIQTGLITSLVTGVALIFWMVAQLDPGHFAMSLPLGGIYATCFMANLIARESYFHHLQVDEEGSWVAMATRSIAFATPENGGQSEVTQEMGLEENKGK